MLRRFDTFETFEDVKKMHRDLKDNLTFEDINAGNVLTSVPTTETLEKGHCTLREISGVPTLYYRNLSGTIYEWVGTAS